MPSAATSLASALMHWPVWLWFGRQDIRSRYRGSLLGPLWLVLNLGILVSTLSLIYATVFDLPLNVYMPHVTTGFLAWWFIAGVMTDSCTAFTANAQIIRNLPLPLGIHVLRVLTRNSLLMAHNFIVYLVVAIIFSIWPNLNTLLVLPGLLLVCGLLFTIGLSFAIVCARYRDVPHIVTSIIQVVMFVTPIMFLKDMLARKAILADVNPFYHMIEAIRAPLLGQAPEILTWGFLITGNLVSAFVAVWLIRRAGHRVPYLV
ncbi:ABC transporter permease [Methylocaldum sp. MU1018]